MNDKWQKHVIHQAITILIVFVILWGFSLLGFNIPVVRQIVGFIFITLVPGSLILAILNVRKLGFIKTLVFSVGLSLAFLMFIGAFANVVLPLIGINKPLSSLPILSTLSISTLILIVMAYLRNRNLVPLSTCNEIHENSHFSFNVLLFLILLPLLSVLGALIVNSYHNNLVLLILILIICLIPIFIGFNKIIPKEMYPLAIISIALTLLIHRALISSYLTGWDIHQEYYIQGLVIKNGYWQWTIPNNINAMLSITVLCPIYSFVLKIDGMWVLKIVYPLLFSFVPLTLFEVYKEYWGAKRAFFASFLFISMVIFFTEMTALGRQEIAEIFLSLIILLIIDRSLGNKLKSTLATVFLMSLVVSHYGLTFVTIAIFGIAWILLFFSKINIFRNWYKIITTKLPFYSTKQNTNNLKTFFKTPLSSGYLLLYFIAFTLIWYIIISSGSPFYTIVRIQNSLYSKLIDFAQVHAREPLVSTALGLDFGQVSILGKLFRIIQILIEMSIIISLFNMIFGYCPAKIKVEYRVLALGNGLILIACIVIPGFSGYLNATRFFQIGLIMLSPFCISGIKDLCKIIIRGLKLLPVNINGSLTKPFTVYVCIMIILIPYYLFNTGFIYEVSKSSYSAGQMPSSMSLSNYRDDFPEYNLDQAVAAQWLTQYSDNQIKVYGDQYSDLTLQDFMFTRVETLPDDIDQMTTDHYIYLRAWNLNKNERVLYSGNIINFSNTSKLAEQIRNKSLVYNNMYTEIIAP